MRNGSVGICSLRELDPWHVGERSNASLAIQRNGCIPCGVPHVHFPGSRGVVAGPNFNRVAEAHDAGEAAGGFDVEAGNQPGVLPKLQ